MKCAAYTDYKKSPLEWAGPIPAHWQIKKIGHLALLKSGENIVSEEIAEGGEYPVFGGNGFRGYFNQYTHDGDFVLIGRQGALCGNINYASRKFWASEHALVAHSLTEFDVRWFGETLRAMNLNQYSVSAAQPGLAASAISALRVPFPPLDEQQTIARFLDATTAQIDTLVAHKRQLIAKLKEKRSALIARTVTRGLPHEAAKAAGLEPNPQMKDSGVDWLGAIPIHWATPPLYARYSVELGKMLSEAKITGEHLIPYLRNVDVQWNVISFQDLPEMDIPPAEYPRYTIRSGDLLVCEGGEVGRAAIVGKFDGVIGYQKALHKLRALRDDEDQRFMCFILEWAAQTGVFNAGGISTIAHLTGEQLRKYRFPKPPKNEQQAIVQYLQRGTDKIAHLQREVETAIARLTEYRQALITSAVTGKIDVRRFDQRTES